MLSKYFWAAVLLLVSTHRDSTAATFDLRGLGSIGSSELEFTVDGLTLRVSTGSGQLVSTAEQFGIDSNGPSDVPELLDGGNGFGDELFFIFNNNSAVLDQILISQFDGEDAGIVNIKTLGDIPIANGANPMGGVNVSTSLHHIRWTGPNAAGATRGFSVDGLVARIVPESSTLSLCGMVVLIGSGLARRRSFR